MGLRCRLFGHIYNEKDICTRCGTAKGSAGLKFKRLRDKSGYVLVGFGKCTDAAVRLPRQIKGKPVCRIEDAAFAGYPIPYTVSLSASVRVIGARAFAATQLTDLTFDGPCEMGEGVFEDCTALREAILPPETVCVPSRTFAGCTGLTEAILPEPVTRLETEAFAGCTALQYLTSTRPPQFGAGTFDGCVSLEEITFSANMTELPDRLLRACRSLTNIRLPATVTRIGQEALRGCVGLNHIDLPDGLTALGAGALAACSALETLTLPNAPLVLERDGQGNGDTLRGCTALHTLTLYPGTVAHFPRGMLADCTALSDIPLVGGKSIHWRAIEKDEGWDAGAGSYVVHLVNGRIRKGC